MGTDLVGLPLKFRLKNKKITLAIAINSKGKKYTFFPTRCSCRKKHEKCFINWKCLVNIYQNRSSYVCRLQSAEYLYENKHINSVFKKMKDMATLSAYHAKKKFMRMLFCFQKSKN